MMMVVMTSFWRPRRHNRATYRPTQTCGLWFT